MEKYFKYIILFFVLSLVSCSSKINTKELTGTWINKENQCEIQLNKDLTFKSKNIPLDVENEYYLSFDKQIKTWEGVWSLEGRQIKLEMDNSYYYFDVNINYLTSEKSLFLRLLEESGGGMIYFNR